MYFLPVFGYLLTKKVQLSRTCSNFTIVFLEYKNIHTTNNFKKMIFSIIHFQLNQFKLIFVHNFLHHRIKKFK